MNLFSHNRLSGFRDAIRQRLRDRGLRQSQLTDIRDVVERVVEGTDGRIRLVSGYRKKLHGVVHAALEYADELVDQLPAAIEINRGSFATHHHVNAFFVGIADLKQAFSRSPELREYLSDHGATASSRCYALLCMRKSEKTVMGMELAGDLMKKEVLQVAVSFSDHMLYAPASSESGTREGLKECLFGGLVTHALELIVQSRIDAHRLQGMHQMLNTRLMHLQHQQRSKSRFESVLSRDIEKTRLELVKLDKTLLDTPQVTPQQSLKHVQDVFSRPDQFVRLSRCTLRLNKMGIKIDRDSKQPCNRLDLIEVTVGNESPRVVSLVHFSDETLLT